MRVGDYGIHLRFTTGNYDITPDNNVAGVYLIALTPSGRTKKWGPANIVSPSIGEYVVQKGDLDEEGRWLFDLAIVKGTLAAPTAVFHALARVSLDIGDPDPSSFP